MKWFCSLQLIKFCKKSLQREMMVEKEKKEASARLALKKDGARVTTVMMLLGEGEIRMSC